MTAQHLMRAVRCLASSVFSSAQIDAVFRAATPLRQEDVEPYLQTVADQLRASPVVGDGTVYRAVEGRSERFSTHR